MKGSLIPILALCPILLLAAGAEGLVVTDAYVRGLPPGVANTAAYMRLANNGAQDLVLTGASTDIADSVTLHTTENHGGMLHMAQRASLVIPAGGEVVLETGGLHLMLMGLAGGAPGDEVTLTLEFEGGLTSTLVLPVISVLEE